MAYSNVASQSAIGTPRAPFHGVAAVAAQSCAQQLSRLSTSSNAVVYAAAFLALADCVYPLVSINRRWLSCRTNLATCAAQTERLDLPAAPVVTVLAVGFRVASWTLLGTQSFTTMPSTLSQRTHTSLPHISDTHSVKKTVARILNLSA